MEKTIREVLADHGATNIEGYNLISNHGYTFDLNGNRYDLRHFRNFYGMECDYWDITSKYPEDEETKTHLTQIVEFANANH